MGSTGSLAARRSHKAAAPRRIPAPARTPAVATSAAVSTASTQPPLVLRYPAAKGSASGSLAIDIRADGSAVGMWPSGRMAVSVEVDTAASADYASASGASEQLYRVVAHPRDSTKAGLPCVTMDGYGSGVICNAAGKTVLSALVRVHVCLCMCA